MPTTEHNPLGLTVIIPVRWSPDRSDIDERLAYVLHDDERPEGVEILVVDDGSERALAQRLRAACERLGFGYHRIDSAGSTFSIGRARNVGTQQARTPFVMFQDADLMPCPGFYRSVLDEIVIQGLDRYAERFLMFAAIYLTREATGEYLGMPASRRRAQYIQHLLEGDTTRIEKFSTGTSTTVWSRHYFLAAGGNDPDFEGWGYEDIEFMCRAIRREKRFPLPTEFALDYRNFQTVTEYRGWKSVYRLYGDMTFQKGMALFHAWHPIENDGSYVKCKERNRKLFERKLKDFAQNAIEPEPLPMPEAGRTLIFRTNPWVYNRWVAPTLGEITLVDETLLTLDEFAAFVQARSIDRVLFHNPYATEHMLAIYQWVRASGLKFLVCERGALPGSVFFDPNGFNGESASYAPERWCRPLSSDEDEAVARYVRELKASEETLEDQPARQGPRALRRKLGLAPQAKVLFVPLQRPSDTVIQYLAGPIGSYDGFLQLVRRLTHCLPPDWVVVAKRHPLETEGPDLPGVLLVDDAHVNDLIELSSALLLINSGVGITGLMYGKPVLHAGQAFFGHDGVARQVSHHDEVLDALAHWQPDPEAVQQFLHYLIFEFYSFARFTTRRVAWTDGALMTATTQIDYHTIRLPGMPAVNLQWRAGAGITRDSILFDRYRAPDGRVLPVQAAAGAPAAKPAAPASPRSPATATVSPRPPAKAASGPAATPAAPPHKPAPAPKRPALVRKLSKLSNNPVMFLRDSQFAFLRSLGHSIEKH